VKFPRLADLVDKVDSLTQTERQVACDSLFLTINWFREVISGLYFYLSFHVMYAIFANLSHFHRFVPCCSNFLCVLFEVICHCCQSVIWNALYQCTFLNKCVIHMYSKAVNRYCQLANGKMLCMVLMLKTLNAFSGQSDAEMKGKVLARLCNITDLQQLLEKFLIGQLLVLLTDYVVFHMFFINIFY